MNALAKFLAKLSPVERLIARTDMEEKIAAKAWPRPLDELINAHGRGEKPSWGLVGDTMEDLARKQFGLTEDPAKAGYMLRDGSMLDFSEGAGFRVQDHRAISPIDPFHHPETGSRTDAMLRFMDKAGAIRLMPESGAAEMIAAPTRRQRSSLEDVVRYFDEVKRRKDVPRRINFRTELSDEAGGSIDYLDEGRPEEYGDMLERFLRKHGKA